MYHSQPHVYLGEVARPRACGFFNPSPLLTIAPYIYVCMLLTVTAQCIFILIVIFNLLLLRLSLTLTLSDVSLRGNDEAASPSVSPSISPSPSPANSPAHDSRSIQDYLSLPRRMSTSLPNCASLQSSAFLFPNSHAHSSHSRSPSPTLSPRTLSPLVGRPRSSSGSPLMKVKHMFRLSGSHLKDISSPNWSPTLSRKKRWGSANALNRHADSEFLYWWMDSTGGEVEHWRLMLEKEGEWVYFWHSLRARMKPAASS